MADVEKFSQESYYRDVIHRMIALHADQRLRAGGKSGDNRPKRDAFSLLHLPFKQRVDGSIPSSLTESGSGEIGRHTILRGWRPLGHAGSSPAFRTKKPGFPGFFAFPRTKRKTRTGPLPSHGSTLSRACVRTPSRANVRRCSRLFAREGKNRGKHQVIPAGRIFPRFT